MMPPRGHDQPCYYCGEPCSSLAGNPARWPVGLCHGDEPGVVKWHHEGCVLERLSRLAEVEAEREKDYQGYKAAVAEEERRADRAEARLASLQTDFHELRDAYVQLAAALTALRKELDSCQRTLVKATETSASMEAERNEAQAWRDATGEALADKLEALAALRKEALEVARPVAAEASNWTIGPEHVRLAVALVAKHGGGNLAAWRTKCAASGLHEHDGCTCSDDELTKRYGGGDVSPATEVCDHHMCWRTTSDGSMPRCERADCPANDATPATEGE